jgi:hypothetical protein
MTGSGAAGQIRRDIGDLSREIAAFAPDRVGKQFETRRLQCAVCLDAEALAATPPMDCPLQVQSVCTSTGSGL